MTGRSAALVFACLVAFACTSSSTAGKSVTSPSPSGGHLGSIGTAGCKPAATFHYLGGGTSGFPEAGMDNTRQRLGAFL